MKHRCDRCQRRRSDVADTSGYGWLCERCFKVVYERDNQPVGTLRSIYQEVVPPPTPHPILYPEQDEIKRLRAVIASYDRLVALQDAQIAKYKAEAAASEKAAKHWETEANGMDNTRQWRAAADALADVRDQVVEILWANPKGSRAAQLTKLHELFPKPPEPVEPPEPWADCCKLPYPHAHGDPYEAAPPRDIGLHMPKPWQHPGRQGPK